MTPYRRLLVPLDASPAAGRGLTEAIDFARAAGACLVLLHVVNDFALVLGNRSRAEYAARRRAALEGATTLLEGATARATAAGVESEAHVVDYRGAAPAECVMAEARSRACDLIVMGTRRRHGLDRLLSGSSAHSVACGASVPVLLVQDA